MASHSQDPPKFAIALTLTPTFYFLAPRGFFYEASRESSGQSGVGGLTLLPTNHKLTFQLGYGNSINDQVE